MIPQQTTEITNGHKKAATTQEKPEAEPDTGEEWSGTADHDGSYFFTAPDRKDVPPPPHIQAVLDKLRFVRRISKIHWEAECPGPSHNYKGGGATMEVRINMQDRVCLRCSGDGYGNKCKFDDILKALDLSTRDLLPGPPQGYRTRQEEGDKGTSEGEWLQVNDEEPCAICGEDNWCSRSADGAVEICRRTDQDPEGRKGKERTDKNGEVYWVFKRRPERAPFQPPHLADGFAAMPITKRLAPEHLADLRRSGLSDQAIKRAAFYTLDNDKVAPALGWTRGGADLGAALTIPYCDAKGALTPYCRLKPDSPRQNDEGKPVKYEAPVGEPSRAYFPPDTVGALADPSVPLLVTEGEKKAAKADQEGFPCVGVPGVWAWQKRRPRNDRDRAVGPRELLDDLATIAWADREVFIVFDSDVTDNHNILQAEWHLAEALTAQGAKVRVVRLLGKQAEEEGKAAKVGLDDFLVGEGPEALRRLLREAQAPQRPPLRHDARRSDWANAQRLVRDHGQDMRYCHTWKQWLVWDGRRWQMDDTGEAQRRCKQAVAALYREASERLDGLRHKLDGMTTRDTGKAELQRQIKAAETDLRHARSSEAVARQKAMLVSAQSEAGIAVRSEELDLDPWLLAVANGTLDLREGVLRPHHREDLITRLAPVEYHPEATAPTWDRFLKRITDGDESLAAYLRRAMGYALTGQVNEQVLFFFHGRGANGKTTFLTTFQELLGEYAMQAQAELILVRRGEAHPTERADLYRKRLVACVEVDEGRAMAESLVKQLTGGERIRARRMKENFWEFTPTHKLILSGNHKPTIRGMDEGIWRRVHLVPFAVSIPEEERDRDLPEKLKGELPGVLAWAVRGCLEWQREGLNPPDQVREATDSYRKEMDELAGFLEEMCQVGPGLRVGAQALHEAYMKWLEADRANWLTRPQLKALLEKHGFSCRRSGKNGSNEYHGLALREEGAKDRGD